MRQPKFMGTCLWTALTHGPQMTFGGEGGGIISHSVSILGVGVGYKTPFLTINIGTCAPCPPPPALQSLALALYAWIWKNKWQDLYWAVANLSCILYSKIMCSYFFHWRASIVNYCLLNVQDAKICMKGFKVLFARFLAETGPSVIWEKIKPPPEGSVSNEVEFSNKSP